MTTAACAICGSQFPTSAMDMTGHGWRCVQCAAKSELVKAQGGSEMAEHLSPQELEGIVASGKSEAVVGAGLGLLGLVLSIATIASGAQIIIVFTGMMVAGFSAFGHGLYRSREARRALQHYPRARVVD